MTQANYNIKRFNAYSDAELLNLLKQYATANKLTYVSSRKFSKHVGISEATFERHFSSWKSFCRRAGLEPRYNRSTNKEELFQNLGWVWEKLGRQPRAREMKQPLSSISDSRYLKEFGNWHKACLEFLVWKMGSSSQKISDKQPANSSLVTVKRDIRRSMPLSVRYEVLKRDGFRCVSCGRSPATHLGVVLHIDHVQPWSKGGETKKENLKTLCVDCNLGKSNS